MSQAVDPILLETASALFARHCSPAQVAAAEAEGWSPALWAELERSGLAAIGAEGSAAEAAAVVRVAARHAAPVPLAETVMASWILRRLGQEIPAGPLTVAVGGEAPYASVARGIVAGGRLAGPEAVHPDGGRRNLAGEPWARVASDAEGAGPAPEAALIRALQISGALERVLELSARYTADRVQFGRPLNQFQAVQQELALLAGEVAAAGAAVEGALADPRPAARSRPRRSGPARRPARRRCSPTSCTGRSATPRSTSSSSSRAASGRGATSSGTRAPGRRSWGGWWWTRAGAGSGRS